MLIKQAVLCDSARRSDSTSFRGIWESEGHQALFPSIGDGLVTLLFVATAADLPIDRRSPQALDGTPFRRRGRGGEGGCGEGG